MLSNKTMNDNYKLNKHNNKNDNKINRGEKDRGTIWTGIIFKMSHVEHMTSASPIIDEFFMKCRINFP